MIERLEIEDFQAHHHLVVDIDPAVTTIVGPSDAGKSAVIRALIWLATNRPLGQTYIREGTKRARVTLSVDGHKVIRGRSSATNTYSLDGEELKAFVNDVPAEVKDLLNISSINLQNQHDSPFWFSATPGEVSKQLNQIVDLSIIDRTLANLDKAHRKTTAEVQTLEDQEDEAKATRSSLSWARKAQQDLGSVEECEERWKGATRIHARAVAGTKAVRLHKETAELAGAQLETAECVLHHGSRWEGVRSQVSLLQQLVHDVRRYTVEQRQPIPDLTDLERLRETAVEAAIRIPVLKGTITALRIQSQAVRDAGKELERLEEQFHKQIGEVCPLCGAEIES